MRGFLSSLVAIVLGLSFCLTASAASSTLYVSKLGNNSDGSSWSKAFTTIQAALDAVPKGGGNRIIIRPDTYMEAMLSPAHSGVKGVYNELIGDFDGAFGGGRKGWVYIDSGDPKQGFKSYDWHGTIRSTQKGWSKEHTDETFSSIIWDRWKLSHVYATGADGGLFWDTTDHTEPFTIIVEDCVGIGRAFGGGVANCLSRDDEPITFRRTHLMALDWWGDTAAAYVRVENKTMPEFPDVVFEDCTMVSPQCALKGGNFGFSTSMKIQVKNCNLVALNFSQPHGTPIDGVIQSVEQGKLLHVDLEDTTIMGYKVFGVRVNKETTKDIQYTTKGSVQAYVQFQQEVPKDIYRLQQWPVDVFAKIAPPVIETTSNGLEDIKMVRKDMCEMSPFVWKGKLMHMACERPGGAVGGPEQYYLELHDAETDEPISKFAQGYGLASVFVEGDTFYAVASRFADKNWNDVTLFWSKDLKNWDQRVIIEQENEHLFNSSLTKGPDGYVLAYESNTPDFPAFTTKFASSPDLKTWTTLPDATFGTNRYTACPEIHYSNGYYYVLYLERRSPRHYYETYLTRSKDLVHWELSSANPVLSPEGLDEGINASDPALIEFDGKTIVYYSVGDQLTWMNTKRGVYPGTMQEYFESFYTQPGIQDHGTPAAQRNWFKDAKFGIFVHWGLYALHAKNDAGPYVSWAMNDEKISVADYEPYADQFNPTKFDANEWMGLAKEAGARYMTFTSKHHEGFSMFDSALTDYDSVDRAAKRDFVRELVDAARAAELKISFYYSMLDWHQPDFKSNLPKYIDEYLFGQVRELCTNYGPIDGIWFDGEWDHPASTWRASELVNMIHALQPQALVNDRLGKGVRGEIEIADFYTREQLSEIQHQTDAEREGIRPWEACLTMGKSWGYRKDDGKPKSSTELIRTLVDVVSRGGNLLLNVGPDADGKIPEPLAKRLRDIGAWLEKNGEGIYNTRAVPGLNIPGAKCTRKGSTLYLHLERHPGDTLSLSPIKNNILKAWVLETDELLSINSATKSITIPTTLPNASVTTIAVQLDGQLQI